MLPVRPTETSTWWKAPELVNKKYIIFHQDDAGLHVSLCVYMVSRVWLFATPWTVAYQAPLSMEFSRQEYWSELPFPIPGDLPSPRIEPMSITWVSCIGRWILYHCTTWEAPHIALKTRQKLLQLSWEVLINLLYSPLDFHLFQTLQNSLNGKNFNSLEEYKRHLEQFFAQTESLGKPELWHFLKMAEGSGTKQWLRCSIKLLVKMKNVFYFYLKSKELSGQPNINEEQTLEKLKRINYILMCDLL